MKQAKFEELKYGDKLISIDSKGNYEFYTYLCPDPGYKKMYAVLMRGNGIDARNYHKPTVESMYVYNDFIKEVVPFVEEIKAKYFREWLEKYESKTK